MKNSYDLVIVGGGIVGLAAAWAGARRSLSVLVVERSARANGATVRNFGMVWPIGQPSGEGLETALRSRELWLEAAAGAGFWSATCGSLHLARRDDEAAVLHEFLERDGAARAGVRWMDADEASERSPAVRREGLLGALWSPHEVCVDPREVPGAMAAWLADEHGVDVAFGTAVARVGDGEVVFAGGRPCECVSSARGVSEGEASRRTGGSAGSVHGHAPVRASSRRSPPAHEHEAARLNPGRLVSDAAPPAMPQIGPGRRPLRGLTPHRSTVRI